MNIFVYIIIEPIVIFMLMAHFVMGEPSPRIFQLITFIIIATVDSNLYEFSAIRLK